MKRKNKKIIIWTSIIVVVVAILAYMRFFNGNLIYFSTGLDKNTLFKVSSEKSDIMEANILLADSKNQYEDLFGSDVWTKNIEGTSFSDYALDHVKSKLIRVKCMNVLAAQRGVVLDRNEQMNVEKAATDYMSRLNVAQISSLGVTKDGLVDMFTDFAVAKRLYDDMTSQVNTEISSDDARVITIQYIYGTSQEAVATAKAKIDSGTSFYSVAKESNEDGEYELELRRGEMDEAFEKVAFNLKSGETSDIVNVGEKFYIIKCISDNEKSKTEANKNTIIENMKLEAFNNIFEKYEADLYVEFNDNLWKKCSVSNAIDTDVNFEDVFNSYFVQ